MYQNKWWENKEEDIMEKIDQLIEDDEISPEEAAFMMGYVGM